MTRGGHLDLLAEISISHDFFAGTLSPFGPIWPSTRRWCLHVKSPMSPMTVTTAYNSIRVSPGSHPPTALGISVFPLLRASAAVTTFVCDTDSELPEVFPQIRLSRRHLAVISTPNDVLYIIHLDFLFVFPVCPVGLGLSMRRMVGKQVPVVGALVSEAYYQNTCLGRNCRTNVSRPCPP
jgi:hypothetical protein